MTTVPRRILISHTSYQLAGGEDQVVLAETQLLRQHKHEVTELPFSNKGLSANAHPLTLLRNALDTVWSGNSQYKAAAQIDANSPAIFHVHNFFPVASPSIHATARNHGAAIVQTLHNYRLLCPNALFFRDGHVCENCLGKFVPWPGVAHACYRDSYVQTAVTATMLTVHRARRTWHRDVDRFIALTEFSRQKFIEGGLPADKIVVKPNFVDRPERPAHRRGNCFLFIGRLIDYKGVQLIPEAWSSTVGRPPIRIIGGGPAEATLRSVIPDTEAIELLGPRPHTETMEQFPGALALLVPSILYENFPMTIVEAFASGVAVIASRLGAMAEIVEDGKTGLLFEAGNAADFAAKLEWAWTHPEEMLAMGANARAEYEAKYTAERNYEMLMDIYQQAIEHRHPSQ